MLNVLMSNEGKVINYKGRVWTCGSHNAVIESLIYQSFMDTAADILKSVDPKKGNSCRECARLYDETPPCNR
jgi:hypothetical protein